MNCKSILITKLGQIKIHNLDVFGSIFFNTNQQDVEVMLYQTWFFLTIFCISFFCMDIGKAAVKFEGNLPVYFNLGYAVTSLKKRYYGQESTFTKTDQEKLENFLKLYSESGKLLGLEPCSILGKPRSDAPFWDCGRKVTREISSNREYRAHQIGGLIATDVAEMVLNTRYQSTNGGHQYSVVTNLLYLGLVAAAKQIASIPWTEQAIESRVIPLIREALASQTRVDKLGNFGPANPWKIKKNHCTFLSEIDEYLANLSNETQNQNLKLRIFSKNGVYKMVGQTRKQSIRTNSAGVYPIQKYVAVGSLSDDINETRKEYEQQLATIFSCWDIVKNRYSLSHRHSEHFGKAEEQDFVISEKGCYNRTSLTLRLGYITGKISNWYRDISLGGSSPQRTPSGGWLPPCKKGETRIPMIYPQKDYENFYKDMRLR